MTLKEFLFALVDARGFDEHALWQTIDDAAHAVGSESIKQIHLADSNDLIAFEFSYYSVGIMGAGSALLHGPCKVQILPQYADVSQVEPYSVDSTEIMDKPLIDVLKKVCEISLKHVQSLERGYWPEGSLQRKLIEG